MNCTCWEKHEEIWTKNNTEEPEAWQTAKEEALFKDYEEKE